MRRSHCRILCLLVLVLTSALLAPVTPELASDNANLLVRSGKLVKVTHSEVILEIAGECGWRKITFSIIENAKLESAKLGDTVNVIYARHSPNDVLVRVIKPGPHPPNPSRVALLEQPAIGVEPIADKAAAQILASAGTIRPRPSKPGDLILNDAQAASR